LRDWLRPVRDTFGKNPPGQDRARTQAEHESEAGDAPHATLEQYCDHLDYLAKAIGHDHVGIGSDFFGGPQPDGLEDCSTFPSIFAELIRRGWTEKNLAKLASGNMLRVMRAVEKAAG
jgi:membrane dipeptidase